MIDTSRLAWRLRRSMLRGYEFALYAMLLALAGSVVLLLAAGQEDGYCGKAQSSAAVMAR